VATARLTDIGDSARLFALALVSSADTGINVWNNKRTYNFWRPSSAILNAAGDGNSATEPDAAWLPLINDPPYPDYTSGANGNTGATVRALQNFFGGDEWTFDATTNATEGGQPIRAAHVSPLFGTGRRCRGGAHPAWHPLPLCR
jgi:hypothetical protein